MLAWGIITVTLCRLQEAFVFCQQRVLSTRSLHAEAGIFGKVMRVLGIAVALTVRHVCPAKALLSKAECQAFPVCWRRLLIGLFIVHSSVVILLVLMYQIVGA